MPLRMSRKSSGTDIIRAASDLGHAVDVNPLGYNVIIIKK
jgi:hypothetical protein